MTLYTLLILCFGTFDTSQTELENTIWMFTPDIRAYYPEQPYSFIKIGTNNEVLFLNIQGDSIGSSIYSVRTDGDFKLLDHQMYQRISIDSKNQISLVMEGVEIIESDDEPIRKGEFKLNYIKLNPTIIELSQNDLESIMTNSDWMHIMQKENRETKQLMSITKWNSSDPNSNTEDVGMNDEILPGHLIKIGESIILITNRGQNKFTKIAVNRISNSELSVIHYYGDNREYIFKKE